MKNPHHVLAPIAALVGLSGIAVAEVWPVEIQSDQSDVEVALDLTVPFAGTLIGDYDAKTNPGGTRTVPGVFGGSGNNPIPYEASFGLADVSTSAPGGTFELDWVPTSSIASISTLAIDLLGAAAPEIDLSLTIEFETFRTFNPDSLFPGGTAFTVPLGTATLQSLSATQIGPAPLSISPSKGGNWIFTGAVPVEVLGSLTLQGQPFELGPFEAVLPVSGGLIQTAAGIEMMVVYETQQAFDQILDTPFPDQLIELPTILPPGQIASLIFSGVLQRVVGTAGASGMLVAVSTTTNPIGDLNGDGTVNGADLTILLAAWGDGGGPADLNGDGTVNGADLTVLLANWGEGA